jgi:Immunity protein family (Imm11)
LRSLPEFETVNEDDDWEMIYRFNGTPIGAEWRPLRVEAYEEEIIEQRPPGDCPWLFTAVPTLSGRAVKTLRTILDGNGELLPLDSHEGDYFLFNVTRVVDALNEAESDIVRFPDGKKVLDITRFVFIPQQVEGLDVFKLPQRPLGLTFVTDRFVQAVRDAGLVGFCFEWLWASEQRSSSPLLYLEKLQ